MANQRRSTSKDVPPGSGVLKIPGLLETGPYDIRTTICPRKIYWELKQIEGIEDSDWMLHPEIIEEQLEILKNYGISGARVAILPFEITRDGKNYNFSPIETILNITHKLDMNVDLCLGPYDFPYGPQGVRFPLVLNEKLVDYFDQENTNHIEITDKGWVFEYGMEYLTRVMEIYGNDLRIDKFYWGNEYPDKHEIEGVKGTLSVRQKVMFKMIKLITEKTGKQIAFNTNIHPVFYLKLKRVFGETLNLLKSQGVLGIDTYPTQEDKIPGLRIIKPFYGKLLNMVSEMFPETGIIFTEFQAEPWPDETLAGLPWFTILNTYPDKIEQFYSESFPQMVKSHINVSGLSEINLWGAPLWLTAIKTGNGLPLNQIKKYLISDRRDSLETLE